MQWVKRRRRKTLVVTIFLFYHLSLHLNQNTVGVLKLYTKMRRRPPLVEIKLLHILSDGTFSSPEHVFESSPDQPQCDKTKFQGIFYLMEPSFKSDLQVHSRSGCLNHWMEDHQGSYTLRHLLEICATGSTSWDKKHDITMSNNYCTECHFSAEQHDENRNYQLIIRYSTHYCKKHNDREKNTWTSLQQMWIWSGGQKYEQDDGPLTGVWQYILLPL